MARRTPGAATEAPVPLSDHELIAAVPELWDFMVAVGLEPEYLTEMVRAANVVEHKKEVFRARAEALRRAEHPGEVRELTRTILDERGVVAPPTHRERVEAERAAPCWSGPRGSEAQRQTAGERE